MDGDENDMIPVKDMSEKDKHTRGLYHDKDSSLVQERAGISKLSREELEDRHLRLLEENQILKKHCHKQEDKIKRLATKLLRLVQDRKKSGEAAGVQRDPETAELIQSQQDQIRQMGRQITQLKDKLLVARQQVTTSQGSRPGRPLAPKADTLRRPSSRPSSKTSGSQRRQPAGSVDQQLPPYAEQLLVEAREAAARLQQQSAALAQRNRELDETFSTLREQCNMYEQELEMLKEQSRVKDLEHEEELQTLRGQANQANRTKLAENVEMIKLQRELKQTTSRLAALQTHANSLEETLRTERPAYERASREMVELKRLYDEEQARVQQLQRDASAATLAKQKLEEVEMALRDAQRENELLRAANEKLSEIGSDVGWQQREQQADVAQLRAQLSSSESSLRAEQARRRQLSDQLTAEQQRSWRLQAEARDLQTQLLRAMTMQPVPPPVPSRALTAELPAPPRPETRDKAVCTSPLPDPEREPQPEPEPESSPPPAPPDTPTAELLSRIDTGEPLPRQLAALHCRYVETAQELEKARTLLDVQKQINAGQRQELALLSTRVKELGAERERAEAELRAALQARTGRVLQLETRLRELAYRAPGQPGPPRLAPLDASMQLEPGTCLLELHVERLALDVAGRARVGHEGVFLTWIFYNQDMHFTPVVHADRGGSELRFACSSLYKVLLDSALIHYLSQDLVTIEVQGTEGGSECHQLGSTTISCRELLEYPRNRLHGTAEVDGLGTLAYWFRSDGGALEHYLQTRGDGMERGLERSAEDRADSGAGDQTIMAGSPDICEPSAAVKQGKGPAAVSTPVRRRLATRADPALLAPPGGGGRRSKRPSPRVVTASDTEVTEYEYSPERTPRGPPASRARSEADMGRVPPRPAARRQPAARGGGGGGGDASPPRRAAPAQSRGQQRRRESDVREETETPRRPSRKERRESGGVVGRRESVRGHAERRQSVREAQRRESVRGDTHRRESVTDSIERRKSFRETERRDITSDIGHRDRDVGTVRETDRRQSVRETDRRRSIRAETDHQVPTRDVKEPRVSGQTRPSAEPRPVGARVIQSGPARPSEAEEAQRGPQQAPRPPPRSTGYATYTESSASEASSLEELGRPETPPRREQRGQDRAEREEKRGQDRAEREPQQQRQQPQPEKRQQKRPEKQQLTRGTTLKVGGSSDSGGSAGGPQSGGGSSLSSAADGPGAPDRSPLTAGRSPPSPDHPRPRRRERAGGSSPSSPGAWGGGGGSDSDRSQERTVVAAGGGMRVAADVHRRGSESSVTPSTGTGTDSDGVVLHRAAAETPSASEAVTITVHEVTLSPSAEVYRRGTSTATGTPGDRPRLFVEYRFLDVPPEQLESPHSLPLPEPGEPLVFNFRKVIPVAGRQLSARRRLLTSQLEPASATTDQNVMTFTVVAEPEDSEDEEAECADVGYAQLSLPEVLSSGRDLNQNRLPLRTADGQPAGHLSVSLQAQQALRAAASGQPE
ncbi:protein fantom-like [Amphibalanus amphitrite]|uniref:protein fantom-like n=1 Tax=Amphibalanus amphitrite TaxID=1232801 RepID=UPI001C9264A3|nr:protein fantom-like [Amphibalanus amphitrite]